VDSSIVGIVDTVSLDDPPAAEKKKATPAQGRSGSPDQAPSREQKKDN
jgi:hypothetical protein